MQIIYKWVHKCNIFESNCFSFNEIHTLLQHSCGYSTLKSYFQIQSNIYKSCAFMWYDSVISFICNCELCALIPDSVRTVPPQCSRHSKMLSMPSTVQLWVWLLLFLALFNLFLSINHSNSLCVPKWGYKFRFVINRVSVSRVCDVFMWIHHELCQYSQNMQFVSDDTALPGWHLWSLS